MANNQQTSAGTSVQQQNTVTANSSGSTNSGASGSSSNAYGTEFASQTDIAKMKKQNHQSTNKKPQNSSRNYGQNSQS
ncbi:gamma-type small acid-soluble spore protein [Bacillus massiliigorillae]|uniref:gamma-type small acid-soluble spore protein n=1 Tax=Bacillus massiliigorillae TaxID=1243664 RepID=UPI0003A5FB5F|nr:gamma-type small acid-soluble spore protein [Bacillus massiliigorillae]